MTVSETAVHLTVYVRTYCHLCHDLLKQLRSWQARYPLRIRTIDIDQDPALEHRYGEWVPVLVDANDNEICHYFLDETALTAHLTKIG